jgi:glycosyltransferase involved in cell wall biosynthesis
MAENALRFGADKPLAVITTMTRWDEPPRIRHQVTRQLTRFYNVLYVELIYSAAGDPESVRHIADDLIVCRPAGLPWLTRKLRNNVAVFRRLCNGGYARRIESIVRRLGYERAVLVNFQFDFPEIMRSQLFQPRLYLCNDEFQTQSRPWVRALNRHAEEEVIRRADISLAVSTPLLEKLQRCAARAMLFLPGHEFDVDETSGRTAPAARGGRAIRACYMGFINDRLRADWLLRLSAEPGVTLSLIGLVENEQLYAELLARDNVEHLGTLVGAELRERMSGCDVFIMPYDISQTVVRVITAPNKLFQYLACGRPVVCANLPNLLPLPDKFVYTASDAEQFVRALHVAVEEDSAALAAARVAYSARNTWRVRGDQLRDIIEGGAST